MCLVPNRVEPYTAGHIHLLTPRALGFAAAKEQLGTASSELTELANCEKKDLLPHRDEESHVALTAAVASVASGQTSACGESCCVAIQPLVAKACARGHF